MRPVLMPASVAVIGASRRPGSVGRTILCNIIDGGFPSPVYTVNPGTAELDGIPWLPSAAALPDQVDLAVIAVPAGVVLGSSTGDVYGGAVALAFRCRSWSTVLLAPILVARHPLGPTYVVPDGDECRPVSEMRHRPWRTSAKRAQTASGPGIVSGGGEATTTKRQKKPKTAEKVTVPTPEAWAEESLKNAPPRSEEWAKRVARIYCLDIGDESDEERAR
jgi:hypothetical protein